ncbi:MAG: DUF3078 domain-containing protein [Gemmatimonadales bacterium]|nr:DUF3078 domain-containing protein [Gemmatimonadales bacterium]
MMKKMNLMIGTSVLVLILGGVSSIVAAGEEALEGDASGVWKKEFETGLNIIQSSYTDNWNGGEKGSLVWTARLDGQMEKQLNKLTNWRNTLQLVYGQTHNQDRDSNGDLYWRTPDKSDDVIDFESLFRFTPESWVDPFVALNFKSMFKDLTDPGQRALNFNPLKFKETAGLAKKMIDSDGRFMMTRLGATFTQNRRATFVSSAPDESTETEMTTEMGVEMITEYKAAVLEEKVVWDSKLTLSLPLIYSGKSVFEEDLTAADLESFGLPADIADYTTTVEADFENTFTTRITSLISVKLFLRWVYKKYDNSVKPVVENGVLMNADGVRSAIRKSGQLKQTLALGLTYKFN